MQYYIFYKRGDSPFTKLEPNVHATLYNRPEISAALDFLRANHAARGVAMVLGDEMYNIIVFEASASASEASAFSL